MSARSYLSRIAWLIVITLVAALGVALAWSAWKWGEEPPDYVYNLHDGQVAGATAYGGAWEVGGGMVRNNSDERGAKLVMGSKRWKDYTLTADLKFDGEHGDMGLLVRSTDEEDGVDAYDGYYVGLRTTDATLIIGRSDYGWMEARPVPMPGGVHANTWYHLTVTAVGCRIAASSQNLTTGQQAWITIEEHPCAASGRIGLRSLATGGMWRNIHIHPATMNDYLAIRSRAGSIEQPEFPRREADYNRSFRFSSSYDSFGGPPAALPETHVPLVHTADIQSLPLSQKSPVSLRGAVTYVTRNLYIQDADGGVFVTDAKMPSLNVGDEVEVTGRVQPGLYSATISDASVRLLWSGTPIPPLAITALQAASGAYDARFVELDGRLTAIRQVGPNEQALEFVQDGQPFSALYRNQSSGSLPPLEINSLLRIRGVCVLDRKITREITPFAILLRSNNDIQVIAPPPWWTPWHIAMLFVTLIGLALLVQLAYFRAQSWRAHTITQERERLAHDIHDTMAQSFAGVGYQIQGIRSAVIRKGHPEFRSVAEQLEVAYQLVRRSHEEASSTIAMLHASAASGVEDLLASLASTAKKIAGGEIDVQTLIVGTPFRLDLRLENALLHIGQEAITNAVSHGAPTRLIIALNYDEPRVQLRVEDNGSSFDASTNVAGFGILGMQRRALAIGAQMQILGEPGKGTRVIVDAISKPSTLRARALSKGMDWLQKLARRLRIV